MGGCRGTVEFHKVLMQGYAESMISIRAKFFFLLELYHAPLCTAMAQDFPEIQGGGSLILAWQIRNKRVLVVGGGEVCFPNPSPLQAN